MVYTVVIGMRVPWRVALGGVAIAGLLFVATAGIGLRERLITAIPATLKHAIAAGIGLLVAFLPDGPIGRILHPLGYDVFFRESAVVISVLFVGSPFYLRAAIAAFPELDEDVMAAARTLGASPARVFARIAIPVSLPALSAGAALAFARGVGEFG